MFALKSRVLLCGGVKEKPLYHLCVRGEAKSNFFLEFRRRMSGRDSLLSVCVCVCVFVAVPILGDVEEITSIL